MLRRYSVTVAGQARTVLLVGAEVHSGFMPWSSWDYLFGRSDQPPTAEEKAWVTKFRDRTVLFGDAGGAVVLRGAEGERGLLGFVLRSDGNGFEGLYVPACGFAQRPYVSFPWRLAWIARLMRLIPAGLYDRLIRALDRR